jgi:hypothetical protein
MGMAVSHGLRVLTDAASRQGGYSSRMEEPHEDR